MVELTLAIDQSTQGTKVLLIDANQTIRFKAYSPHHQHRENGYVEHDLTEILQNLKALTKQALEAVSPSDITAVALTNQRETVAAWSRTTGKPLAPAIVWQDDRAQHVITRLKAHADEIKGRTGLPPSPLFSAAKMHWLLAYDQAVMSAATQHCLCLGTIDAWLVYQLTNGSAFVTEPSNASRTQLMALDTCNWDPTLLQWFNIPLEALPKIIASDSNFGTTNLFGQLTKQIPIISVLGDSQAALLAEVGPDTGAGKVTFGTGSSIAFNTGTTPLIVTGLNTSVAWQQGANVSYMLEANVTYAGAIVSWLQQLGLINEPKETSALAFSADPADHTLLLPNFNGHAAWLQMSAASGKPELVKAALDAIVQQISDHLATIDSQLNTANSLVRVDGGMIHNDYLMQRLADLSRHPICLAEIEELSAVGTCLNGHHQHLRAKKRQPDRLPRLPTDVAEATRTNWHNAMHALATPLS